MYSLKSKRQEFKERGIFYTPPELAAYLRSLLPENVTEIYDPACGHGALLAVFDSAKYGQDINPEAAGYAATLPDARIVCGDTLAADAFDREFEYIIANPPFSVKWQPENRAPFNLADGILPPPARADFAFMLHIWHKLKQGGCAVVLHAPGTLYRGQREAKIRSWFVRQKCVEQIIAIGAGEFEDTAIPTVVWVLHKGRQFEAVRFTDRESGDSISVPLQKIADNDYNLSPQLYLGGIQAAREAPPPFDPIEAEEDMRRLFLKRLRISLNMSRELHELFGAPDYRPFARDIIATAQEFLTDGRQLSLPF